MEMTKLAFDWTTKKRLDFWEFPSRDGFRCMDSR
jgi:hypothetical protein